MDRELIERFLVNEGLEPELLKNLSAQDLQDLLEVVGLELNEDTSGMRIVSLADATGGADALPADTASMDFYLEKMNADQLKCVAKRFNPKANANRVAESKNVIKKALKKPDAIDKVIAELSPLERTILTELKRRGGEADGWQLIFYAAARGFKPAKSVTSGSVYKNTLSSDPGVAFLATLLRDGLVLPASNTASWFSRSYFYSYNDKASPEDDVVFVEKRILARLPDEKTVKPLDLKLEPLEGIQGGQTAHPVSLLLELDEILKLIQDEGGLQVTNTGSISKTQLKRFAKARAFLEARFEPLLEIILAMGLLVAPKQKKDPWTLNLNRLNEFQLAPLKIRYSMAVQAFLNQADSSYEYSSTKLVSKPVARAALLEALSLLPKEAVSLKLALNQFWLNVLRFAVEEPRRSWDTDEAPKLPNWFAKELIGNFQLMGLVSISQIAEVKASPSEVKIGKYDNGELVIRDYESQDIATQNYSLNLAEGYGWYQEGTELLNSLAQDDDSSATSTDTISQLMGVDTQTGDLIERALLIQPNFDILVYLDKLSPFSLASLNAADCQRIDAQTATYSLSRSSLYKALETGYDLDKLKHLLEKSSYALPSNVKASLDDWALRRERLSILENSTLLEFANQEERDQALSKHNQARIIAERFLLVPQQVKMAFKKQGIQTIHNYHSSPTRVIKFKEDGHFELKGATDLAGRVVISKIARVSGNNYQLDAEAIQEGALSKSIYDALLVRTISGLPHQIEALIKIWQQKTDNPTLTKVSLFQHASAADLAKHPSIAKHLDAQLSTTSFLIKEGQEKDLRQSLKSLNVGVSLTFKQDLKAQESQSSILQTGLNTRKMRELIEDAIEKGRSLELKYHREQTSYNRYGYSKTSKGKMVTETIKPSEVYYRASIPYFDGWGSKEDRLRNIRIGYIVGIAVL